MRINILIPTFLSSTSERASGSAKCVYSSFLSTQYAGKWTHVRENAFYERRVASGLSFFECVGRVYAMCNIDTHSVGEISSEAGAFVVLCRPQERGINMEH